MYLPPAFRVGDKEALEQAAAVGFGHLCIVANGQIESTPVPFLVDVDSASTPQLLAHLARANPIARTMGTNCDALMIVSGPDAYVSPSWYPSKQDHGRVVPTWNYLTVHLRGTASIVDDDDIVESIVRRLTERHESRLETSWSLDDAPSEFLAAQRRAIVGLQMSVTDVMGKAKMSQNRDADDSDGARRGLAAGDHRSQRVAAFMEDM